MKKITVYIFIILLSALAISCSKDDSSSQVPVSGITLDFTKTIGGTKNDRAQAVVKTTDGGFIILGYTQSMDNDITDKQNESYDYWVLKFNSSNELQWSKTYGGTENDRGEDIIQTQDGGYAIIGFTASNDEDVTINAGFQDYWVVKLDASGNITWQKSFGYSGIDSGTSILQTNDGGFIVTGVLDVTASNGQGNTKNTQHAGGDFWTLKLDSSGTIEWSKYFGGSFTDTPSDIIQTDDNGYIMVGFSDSDDVDITGSKGSYDFWVVKVSSSGETLWEKSFGGTEIDEARAIVKSGDGNYIIAGDTRSNNIDVSLNHGAADLWLIKITPSGELLWEKTYGGNGFDVARDITKTQDNNFLISGSSRSIDGDLIANQGQNDAWIIKVNSAGQLQWQKSVGGSNIDFAYSVAQLNNETIVAVGESSSDDGDISENKGFTDLLIIKLK